MSNFDSEVRIRQSIAIKLMRFSGKEALRIQQSLTRDDVTLKSAELANVFTTGDRRVKEILVGGIRRRFPEDSVYSEESPGYFGSGKFGWRIDEIDGSVAYRHRLGEWAISTGLDVEDNLEVGLVLFPAHRMMYKARRNRSATLNGRFIKTSTLQNLREVILMLGEPYLRDVEDLRVKVHPIREAFAGKVQAIYSEPCGAWTMCNIARGIGAPVFLHTGGLTLEDLGAAPLIITEAGGVHSPIDKAKPRQPFLAAANQALFYQTLEVLGPKLIDQVGLQVS